MGQGSGALARLRSLDDRVLGPSDSERGWWVNMLLGLHPYLARLWLASAAVYAVVAVVSLARGNPGHVGLAAVNAVVALTGAVASRRLPARPKARR